MFFEFFEFFSVQIKHKIEMNLLFCLNLLKNLLCGNWYQSCKIYISGVLLKLLFSAQLSTCTIHRFLVSFHLDGIIKREIHAYFCVCLFIHCIESCRFRPQLLLLSLQSLDHNIKLWSINAVICFAVMIRCRRYGN